MSRLLGRINGESQSSYKIVNKQWLKMKAMQVFLVFVGAVVAGVS
jgi:hypothetical protein